MIIMSEAEPIQIFKGRNILFIMYEMALLALAFSSFQLSFTWGIPNTFIRLGAGLIVIVYWIYYPNDFLFDRKKSWIALLFTVLFIYRLMFVDIKIKPEPLVSNLMCWVCGMSVILSTLDIKRCLMKLLTKSLGWILAFSLPWWVLYLCGVPLPHAPMFFDGTFYIHTNYYLFQVNSEYQDILHRFACVFQEPGHLATTCVLLMAANRFNFHRWDILLMLAAVLFSLSLAGYMMLAGGYGLFLMVNSRRRVLYLSLFSALIVAVSIYAYQTKKENGVLYQFIFSRLEYQGGKMKGNNRFTGTLELQYRYMEADGRIWWGEGKQLNENGRITDWTVGSAGWKRYIAWNGYVGAFLTLLLLFSYVTKSREIICFLVLYLLANVIRDYPLREYWLYIFIPAMTLLPLEGKKAPPLSGEDEECECKEEKEVAV